MMQNKLMFLSVQERQIFVTTKMQDKSAIGTFAMFTNIGVILYNGGITNDGTYYKKDEHLPKTTNQNNALRKFKRIFADGVDDDDLKDFHIYFGKIGSIIDGINAWTSVYDILEKTSEGREFVKRYNFKLLALINMNSYGVRYNSKDKSGDLYDGYVFHDNSNDTLILDVNGKKTYSYSIIDM